MRRGSSGSVGAKEAEEARYHLWSTSRLFYREATSRQAIAIRYTNFQIVNNCVSFLTGDAFK